VTAHELTHGVTYYTSNLIYKDDSGAMNEAMSDIFAAAIERVKGGKGNQKVWIMGEDITLSGSGVRNMVSFRVE
jgi:bacillolysin